MDLGKLKTLDSYEKIQTKQSKSMIEMLPSTFLEQSIRPDRNINPKYTNLNMEERISNKIWEKRYLAKDPKLQGSSQDLQVER